MGVVKLAAATYEDRAARNRHAVAALLIGDVVGDLVSNATNLANGKMAREKCERDADAQRFLQQWEEQQQREAELALAVVIEDSSGCNEHARPVADPGANYLQSLIRRRAISKLGLEYPAISGGGGHH